MQPNLLETRFLLQQRRGQCRPYLIPHRHQHILLLEAFLPLTYPGDNVYPLVSA